MRRLGPILALGGIVLSAACAEDRSPVSPDADAPTAISENAAMDARSAGEPYTMDPELQAEIEGRLENYVRQKATAIEAARAEAGVRLPDGVRVAPAGFAWIGLVDEQTVGTEVFFLDRGNKQIPIQWVPNDPRRNGRDDVGYAVDDLGLFGNYAVPGVTAPEFLGAVDRAMATWDGQQCSKGLNIPKGDFFDWLFFDSDVFHEGFFPLGPNVIGSTSLFVFVDENGPTDIDGDGALDYAFAIITYNSLFPWGIDTDVVIDVETVVLHEMGHGLGQAHFGTAFVTLANGKLHFAPRSVMNAAYSGLQQSLTGTDRAGHCSMYGSWPNN